MLQKDKKTAYVKKAYLGRSGSGKTTKILQDIQVIKDTKVAAFVHESEMDKFAEILNNVKFFSFNDSIKDVLEDKTFDTLIVDGFLAMCVDNSNRELPKNIFWSFQDVYAILVLSDLFSELKSVYSDVLNEINKEIHESKECIVIDVET